MEAITTINLFLVLSILITFFFILKMLSSLFFRLRRGFYKGLSFSKWLLATGAFSAIDFSAYLHFFK